MLYAQLIWNAVNAVILHLIYVILEILAVRDTFDDNIQADELSGEDPIGLTLKSHSVS